MQVKTSIIPFPDVIVVQSLYVGHERCVGDGSGPEQSATCREGWRPVDSHEDLSGSMRANGAIIERDPKRESIILDSFWPGGQPVCMCAYVQCAVCPRGGLVNGDMVMGQARVDFWRLDMRRHGLEAIGCRGNSHY